MLLDRRPPDDAVRCEARPIARIGSTRQRQILLGTAVLLLVVCGTLFRPSPAGASRHPHPHPETAFERHVAHAVLQVLNAERRRHGERALRLNRALCHSARRHDLAMARANRMSHQLPGEPPFTRRIAQAGYKWRTAGENVGWNALVSRRGAIELELLMYREKPPNDGHRRNILDRHFRDVGVDIFVDSAHHKVWLTTDFGSR
jgi:uncharacterized protein YkwD